VYADQTVQTRARAIIDAKVPYGALLLEQVNRQPWHRKIEEAISVLMRGDEFGIGDILAEAGIDENSIMRPVATAYARKIMTALTGPANVEVPVMVPQQSDRPQ